MKYILSILLLFTSSKIYSQADSLLIINNSLLRSLENLIEEDSENDILDKIYDLIDDPISINSATRGDLENIQILSDYEISQIINWKKLNNGFNSLDELYLIKGLDSEKIPLLKLLLTTKSIQPFELNFRSRAQRKLSLQNDINYLGSSTKLYNRVTTRYSNIKLGLITEKDAGERKINDHLSGFIEYNSSSFINKIIFGDYIIRFGQGLTLWSPYAFSKGSNATHSVNKSGEIIKGYYSTDENLFFRGSAVELKFNGLSTTMFYSQNYIDASFKDDSLTSFYSLGYHRTDNELRKKNTLKHNAIGGIIEYNFDNENKISYLYFNQIFDKPFSSESDFLIYNTKTSFHSVSVSSIIDLIKFNGEYTFLGNNSAFINNLQINLSDNYSFIASYRNYSQNYYNIYAKGFGEYSNTRNETGFYTGFLIKSSFGKINFYYDLFRRPNTSTSSIFPLNGRDLMIFYSTKLSRNSNLQVKIKNEKKKFTTKSDIGYEQVEEIKQNYRITLTNKINKNIYFTSRLEYVQFNKFQKESGFLIYQDLKYNLGYTNILGRLIYYNTDSYNSRIYEFENDLRGIFSNNPLYGNGFRWYLMLSTTFKEYFRFSIKYSETINSDKIKTNDKYIEFGEVNNFINLQFDIKF